MLENLSIKSLYAPALAEGEGVGTAYEYFAKRLVLRRWLKKSDAPKRILIAGLPQKYGFSFDFLLLADELGATITVVDDRPERLTQFKQMVQSPVDCVLTANIAHLTELSSGFDLVVTSEVLQRIAAVDRQLYVNRLRQLAPRAAIFCPNKENKSHVGVSGLDGLMLAELRELVGNGRNIRSGLIDMPPFPPGITRTDDQREQATSGKFEALAMWGLGVYARSERFLPYSIRKTQSHIVYALLS